MEHKAEVIVIGAGHAGCEAAAAAAKIGCKTILFTINMNNIAAMPCNPSIGGPAKGHLVREIDALGGLMGRITDRTYLQMRMLNTQKGPAVWALRAQADKQVYQRAMLRELEQLACLEIHQAEIVELLFTSENAVAGVVTRTGVKYLAPTVVLATGTFLKGRIFIGRVNYASGPMGQQPALYLSECLQNIGVKLSRFKTGTPARVRKRSLDFSQMTIQPGGFSRHGFSFWEPWQVRPEHACWLTYTNSETHRIIREHLHEAALYTGDITGVGPRYCPSIEGKLLQFPDKDRHQVFIEPEGADTDEMYLAGLSTSLPEEVQELFLRTIPGLANLEIVRPGYAIEYDYIPGNQLNLSLELKNINGLFAAGQINGSSGYEEAAAQGVVAGINAALKVKGKASLILKRAEAYIGVLIDDLVTKDTFEPYRILTSSAEYRLTLRSDTADERLCGYGMAVGLITKTQLDYCKLKYQKINSLYEQMHQVYFNPDQKIRQIFENAGLSAPKNRFNLAEVLKRPDIAVELFTKITPEFQTDSPEFIEVMIRLRYEGYLIKEKGQVQKMISLEQKAIPKNLDYSLITNLAREGREKLEKFKPTTIGQATRISGISPADLTALLFYLENYLRGKQ